MHLLVDLSTNLLQSLSRNSAHLNRYPCTTRWHMGIQVYVTSCLLIRQRCAADAAGHQWPEKHSRRGGRVELEKTRLRSTRESLERGPLWRRKGDRIEPGEGTAGGAGLSEPRGQYMNLLVCQGGSMHCYAGLAELAEAWTRDSRIAESPKSAPRDSRLARLGTLTLFTGSREADSRGCPQVMQHEFEATASCCLHLGLSLAKLS
jgi:hypothetical protein